MKEIKLEGRGITHKLIHISGSRYKLDTKYTYRIGMDKHGKCTFIDPAGGPFMDIGYMIDGMKVKSIYSNGEIEFEDDISGNKSAGAI